MKKRKKARIAKLYYKTWMMVEPWWHLMAGETVRGTQCLITLSSSSHLHTHTNRRTRTFQLFRNISQQNGEQTDDDPDDLHTICTLRLILSHSIGSLAFKHVQWFFPARLLFSNLLKEISFIIISPLGVCIISIGVRVVPEPPPVLRSVHSLIVDT